MPMNLGRNFSLAVLLILLAGATQAAPAPAEPRAATTGERTMLQELVKQTAADMGRWAYTETRITRDAKGRTKEHTVVRHDPSKPYEEQWTPVTVDGQPPTERDLAKYRRRGERQRRRDEEPDARGGARSGRYVSLGEAMELDGTRIAAETAEHLVFEIPLRRRNNDRFPPEKFIVHARVNKARKALENVEVRLREPFRMKLVAKVKAGEGTLDFTAVDPKYAPTLTSIRGDATVSVLFVNVGGEFELDRTDLKRVKPYAERFGVQIGELKALDF